MHHRQFKRYPADEMGSKPHKGIETAALNSTADAMALFIKHGGDKDQIAAAKSVQGKNDVKILLESGLVSSSCARFILFTKADGNQANEAFSRLIEIENLLPRDLLENEQVAGKLMNFWATCILTRAANYDEMVKLVGFFVNEIWNMDGSSILIKEKSYHDLLDGLTESIEKNPAMLRDTASPEKFIEYCGVLLIRAKQGYVLNSVDDNTGSSDWHRLAKKNLADYLELIADSFQSQPDMWNRLGAAKVELLERTAYMYGHSRFETAQRFLIETENLVKDGCTTWAMFGKNEEFLYAYLSFAEDKQYDLKALRAVLEKFVETGYIERNFFSSHHKADGDVMYELASLALRKHYAVEKSKCLELLKDLCTIYVADWKISLVYPLDFMKQAFFNQDLRIDRDMINEAWNSSGKEFLL